MAGIIYLVLQKIAVSLGEATLEKIGTAALEAATILADFQHSLKLIESEFRIMQAFISQVSGGQKVGDRTFDAWLDQVRDAACDVEDIVDEHAFLTAQAMDTGSFFKRKFQHANSFASLQTISRQISQVETRIQKLSTMRDRYGISVGQLNRSSMLQCARQPSLSDSAYLIDDTELVGNVSEIEMLTRWVFDERRDRSIMSIFGMGGLGKTTVASNIYKNQRISRIFDCYAWITLSQSYQLESLLRKIIKQLVDHKAYKDNGIETMSQERLIVELQSYLQYKKYLVVLDDVWDKDAWLFLNYAFVKNNRGSRVLITTRRKDVAYLADEKHVLELKTLPYTEAWHLFCRKAFHRLEDKMCPVNLCHWAEKIVGKCQGLPLAIVSIGSLLSYRESEEHEWNYFYNQLSWQLENNPELNWIMSVLNLSLNDLPTYLRNCFLYCSIFPEDFKIKRNWISKLWIAEGLVEDRGAGTTMEEVAECYLRELTQRSLLAVVGRNLHGKGSSFQMHDLVREASLLVAKKEKFAVVYGNAGSTMVGSAANRLCIQKDAQSLHVTSGSRIRSFILLDTQVPSSWIDGISSNFRLIRVLCLRFASIQNVPGVVTELLNLHYLDLAYTKVKHIPSSFQKLRNLQVLDLRFTYVEQLPREITVLTKLRHLYVYNIHDIRKRGFECITGTEILGDIACLKNLQTLKAVYANRDLVRQLRNLTLMRSLGIMKIQKNCIAELWHTLAKMPRLSRLVISSNKDDTILNFRKINPLTSLESILLRGKLDEGTLPQMFANSEKLTSLRMDNSGLKKDPIRYFSHMLNLVNLYLYGAYNGERLSFHEGWFPKLHTFQLNEMEHLNSIEIKDGTMNVLHQIGLMGLRNLKSVPEGIKYIKTLQQMTLTEMPKEFIDRLQGDDNAIVQHIPKIRDLGPLTVYEWYHSERAKWKYGSFATKYTSSGTS